MGPKTHLLHDVWIRSRLFFPDRRLVQFDCGKLQELDVLCRKLHSGGHRVLVFTQVPPPPRQRATLRCTCNRHQRSRFYLLELLIFRADATPVDCRLRALPGWNR